MPLHDYIVLHYIPCRISVFIEIMYGIYFIRRIGFIEIIITHTYKNKCLIHEIIINIYII